MKKFNVAVVGATGMVGESMISILEERAFPVEQLTPLASKRSLGKKVSFQSKDLEIVDLNNFDLHGNNFCPPYLGSNCAPVIIGHSQVCVEVLE